MRKTSINALEPEAQSAAASQLRKLADDIESGAAQVTDIYVSLNLLDTTPFGAEAVECEIDQTSYLLMLRFERREVEKRKRAEPEEVEIADCPRLVEALAASDNPSTARSSRRRPDKDLHARARMKVFVGAHGKDTRVFVGETEITNFLRRVTVDVNARELPVISLEAVADVEIDAEGEVIIRR
jgi:hypothetical protein